MERREREGYAERVLDCSEGEYDFRKTTEDFWNEETRESALGVLVEGLVEMGCTDGHAGDGDAVLLEQKRGEACSYNLLPVDRVVDGDFETLGFDVVLVFGCGYPYAVLEKELVLPRSFVVCENGGEKGKEKTILLRT